MKDLTIYREINSMIREQFETVAELGESETVAQRIINQICIFGDKANKENLDEKRLNFCDYTKEHLLDKLQDYKGYKSYACDLYILLTEGINADGSATYSTYEAKEYIKEWFEDAGNYYEYAKMNFGEVCNNPFENPEAFQVEMIIQGVNVLLSGVPTISKKWNDEIKITDKLIKEIKEHIETILEIEF